jgi:hypothetical protein
MPLCAVYLKPEFLGFLKRQPNPFELPRTVASAQLRQGISDTFSLGTLSAVAAKDPKLPHQF